MIGATVAVEATATTENVAAITIVAAVAKASKVFRKRAIIAVGEETATVAARIFRKNSAAKLNRGEKYIEINNDALVFF